MWEGRLGGLPIFDCRLAIDEGSFQPSAVSFQPGKIGKVSYWLS